MQPISAPPTQYRLADHVRACRIDEQVLVLDMDRNKYLGFGGPQLAALEALIVDWPRNLEGRSASLTQPRTAASLQPLFAERLLSLAGAALHPARKLPEALECVDPDVHPDRFQPAWRELISVARAATGAAIWLRRLSLADIACRIVRMRSQGPSDAGIDRHAAMRAAVSSYMRLRPFIFTAHDKCLHDSLTLIRFLAARGMFPAWVIAVRIRPFGAHSWVQSRNLVLNDVHEHVRTYTPILVV